MRTALFPCLLLLTLLAPAAATAEQDAAAEVREILASLASPTGSATTAAEQLARLGPDALPVLLDAWRREAGRSNADDQDVGPSVEALQRAIAKHPAGTLERHLRQRLQDDPDTSARIDALATLAVFGSRSGLEVAIEIAEGVAPPVSGSRAFSRSWTAALRTALDDRAPVTRLLAAWRRIPVPLHVPTARVLAERGTRTDLSAVLTIMQRAETGLPELLAVVGEASPVVLSKLPLMGALLEVRSHADRNVRAAVARLLGRSGRNDAFTPLLDLLEDENDTVRRAAGAGLRQLTGATAGSSAAAWKRWYDEERDWLKASRVSTLLRSERPVEAARALRDMGQHPFVAAKHLALVERLVDHATDGVRALALMTLVRMNRAEVVPDLIRHLNDEDAPWRAAVWKALRSLSGEDLPGTYRDWSDANQRWRN